MDRKTCNFLSFFVSIINILQVLYKYFNKIVSLSTPSYFFYANRPSQKQKKVVPEKERRPNNISCVAAVYIFFFVFRFVAVSSNAIF